MKICFIANSKSSHTAKWVNYFASRGHEVHVISHEDAEIPGAQVHYIDYNIRNFPLRVLKVHRLIKEINPDILHAHQANTCGLYAAGMKKFKPVVSAWGSDILAAPERSALMRMIVKYVIKNAEYITSDSYYMTEKIIKYGADKDKVYTLPFGVDSHIFNYRHEYDLESSKLNIVSLRRLEKMFRVDVIIKGFSEALKVNGNLYLTVAADGSEMESLKKLAAELGIEKRISFLGRYNPGDAGKILEGGDIFISVPTSDSTSVSLLEAMAVGVFPVVSDLPANREWVRDKNNGIIINEVSPDSIKDAILYCLGNKVFMKEASEENINTIKERAVWENNAKTVEDIYSKCLKKRGD